MDFTEMLSASYGNRQGEIIAFVKGSHGTTIDFSLSPARSKMSVLNKADE